MKKIVSIIALAFAVAFTGCSTAAPKIEGGVAVDKMISTYRIGAYVDVETAQAKLTAAGFEVVGTYKPAENGTTILYTNAAMKADANKPMRGFAAVGRMLVDDERKQVHIANPIYFGKAYLQDEYNHATASATYTALEKAFGPLKNSEDQWEFAKLADYHFMIGMPYYKDMGIVGTGTTADLLAKAKAAKAITLELSGDRYLAFVELDKRTSGFVKKVGTDKAEVLPWPVLIENGEAKALKAEYHIAISYPLLDLGGFANIMTVPAATLKNLEKTFK
ncbi:MAG: hypothetical protein Q8J85_14965 [Sulfuricurvum sp.]|nr:hypothetical protein [Sulfuricurvum sp.]MDP3023874.1 hypothetical protein [Sulfuricurvum sp.]